MKILVGVPVYAGIEAETFESLSSMLLFTQRQKRNWQIDITTTIRTIVWKAREKIRRKFLRGKYDFLFFAGEDIVFSDDTLIRLISHGLPVISAMYFDRTKLHRPYTFYLNSAGQFHYRDPEIFSGLIKVDATGLDACLIRRDVLEKVPDSAFRPSFPDVGEDLAFFRYVGQLGFDIFVDADTQVGHISEQKKIITIYDHEKAMRDLPHSDTFSVER